MHRFVHKIHKTKDNYGRRCYSQFTRHNSNSVIFHSISIIGTMSVNSWLQRFTGEHFKTKKRFLHQHHRQCFCWVTASLTNYKRAIAKHKHSAVLDCQCIRSKHWVISVCSCSYRWLFQRSSHEWRRHLSSSRTYMYVLQMLNTCVTQDTCFPTFKQSESHVSLITQCFCLSTICLQEIRGSWQKATSQGRWIFHEKNLMRHQQQRANSNAAEQHVWKSWQHWQYTGKLSKLPILWGGTRPQIIHLHGSLGHDILKDSDILARTCGKSFSMNLCSHVHHCVQHTHRQTDRQTDMQTVLERL